MSKRQDRKFKRAVKGSRASRRGESRLQMKIALYNAALKSPGAKTNAFTKPGSKKCHC